MMADQLPKLAAPARRALDAAGILTLHDITKLTRAELAELHGIGNNALTTIDQALSLAKLSFADDQ